MASEPKTSALHSTRPRRAWRRGAAVALALLVALVIIFLAASWTLVSQQTGVDWLVRELVARSGGALEIDGASGVLIDTVRAKRIVWRGPIATVTATDVALTWRPSLLWSRGIVVEGLGAQQLTLEFARSDSPTHTLPDNLALPIDVTIERLGVAELYWHLGTTEGTITGLAFGYRGGAVEHHIADLKLTMEGGAFEGDAKLGARKPFPVAGRVVYVGDVGNKARADLDVTGTLSALTVDAKAEAGIAKGSAHAAFAPLEAVPLRELSIDVHDLDLDAWNHSLPMTRLAVVARAKPAASGLAGEFTATNSLPGNLEADRTPVRALSSRFDWKGDTVSFDDIAADLEGGGKAVGSARITLAGDASASTWAFDVRDVDLRGIYAPLIRTRLAGKVAGDLGATRRTISGDLVDRQIARGLALSFAVTIADRVVAVERIRASAGSAQLDAHGRVALDGERAFTLDARATKFDPSRFGAFPQGTVDGKLAAAGVLEPTWRIGGDASIATGSRLAGIALSGSAHGTFARTFVRDAAVNLHAGTASLVATGSYGGSDERLTATLDAPRLAELVPLLPPIVPRGLAGALDVKAESRGTWPQGGIDIVVRANALKVDPTLAAGALSAHVAIAPGSAARADSMFTSRNLTIAIEAKEAVAPYGRFASARGSIAGSLTQHTIELALRGDDIDLDAKAHGSLRDIGGADLSGASWSGTIDAFENRGPWAARLAAPTALSFAPGQFRLGEAQVAIADGNVHVGEFAWDHGKISTRGSIKAVPVATLARLSGKQLPFASTVTLGGDWSLAATPRLNGTLAVHRESGDVWLAPNATTDSQSFAAGITALEASARFTDDAIAATAMFRSTRAGSGDAKLAIGAGALATPGRIAPEAPMELSIHAQLATLQPLQPWVGTVAVIDGRARLDVAAKGTVGSAPLSGTLVGEALRVDAPQYGLHFVDGRVNARFRERSLVLEELSLTAGTGTFHASGTVDAPPEGTRTPTAHLAWHAERFRVFNRPDLHLIVSGEGKVTSENRKLTLNGKLKADEGSIVYEADPTSTLGDDVVVIGWPNKTAETQPVADIPLALDLDLDFGDQLRFSGRGLEAGLRGNIRVASGPSGFTGKGSIRTVNGTYFAYGQRLVIDPGRLVFDGPLDNPGLDIVALRKNLAVEAGVAVTGTVKVPIVQLTSRPQVPDADKLAWLVLGHSLDRAGGTDVAALQAASAALLGPNSKPVTQTIAQRFGLDDISFKSAQGAPRANSGPDTEGQVMAVGKRLSENLSIVYEQGLTIATNALRLEYNLTGSLTLRAEAGTVSGFGLYYRHTFE
jgi:translocation and assembly module TamB